MSRLKRLFNSVYKLLERMNRHDVFGLSSQLAYFFLLSLFPLLITIFSLLPYLPITDDAIVGFLKDFAPQGTIDFIHANLEDIMHNHNSGLLSFGIVATVWSASNGMNAIIRAINRAYEAKEERHFLVVRGLSVLLTIVMIFVFVIALLLPVFGKQIGIFLFSKIGFTEEFLRVWDMMRWVISTIILFIVFSALYLLTPNRRVKCLSVLPGALFSTVGWMTVSFGFSFYVNNFGNYSVTYGSLGVIIVLMIWFYLSGVILLTGGEINALCNEIKKGGTGKPSNSSKTDAIDQKQ